MNSYHQFSQYHREEALASGSFPSPHYKLLNFGKINVGMSSYFIATTSSFSLVTYCSLPIANYSLPH